jgi:hypothetical protein
MAHWKHPTIRHGSGGEDLSERGARAAMQDGKSRSEYADRLLRLNALVLWRVLGTLRLLLPSVVGFRKSIEFDREADPGVLERPA